MMSSSGPNQAAQAPAPAATNQNNDTKKQNEKIFHLFFKKLASTNPPIYTEACRKLAQWLNDARAYYPEALSWILKLLLRAQRTLSEKAGVDDKSLFHISLVAKSPLAPGYRELVNTVAKYRTQFVNTEFLEPLDVFCRSIDDRFAVKVTEPLPSSTPQIAHANPPVAPSATSIATTSTKQLTIRESNSPRSAPPAQATPSNGVQSTTAVSATVRDAYANHPPQTTPAPHLGVATVGAQVESAGRTDRGSVGVVEGEAGGWVRGARVFAAKHTPTPPPASVPSTVSTKPAPNAAHRPAPAPAPAPTPKLTPASITNPTPNAPATPTYAPNAKSTTRLSTSHPNPKAPTPAPNPNPNPKTPHSNVPAPLAAKAGGVKLRRRNMPRADILDADDEDARRRLEAAKLPGITVERRVAGRRGSGHGNGRGGGGGAAGTGTGAGRRGSGSSVSTTKSPSIPIPASATASASVTASAAAGVVVDKRTPEAAREQDLVKAETTDERTPALPVSQGTGIRGGSGLGSRADSHEPETSIPLRAAYDRKREQGQATPPVPLKTEPTPSIQRDDPTQNRSPHPAPKVNAMPGDGERQVSQSIPLERVESEIAESAPASHVEPLESTAAPSERVASEQTESVSVPQVEGQPDPTDNKVVAVEPGVETSDEPIVPEPSKEPRRPSSTEVEVNAEPAEPVEASKVTEDEGLKSPLSTTESRASTSTPFAPRFQLSQAVFTSPSSISVSPERGASRQDDTPLPFHTVVPSTDSAPAHTAPVAVPSEVPHGSQRATPQVESAAALAEERRSPSVVSARHVSLPMSPRLLEAQMEVVGDEMSISMAPKHLEWRSPSGSVSSLSATASHHGLPMSPRFLESQMDAVGDGEDAEEGKRAMSVMAEPLPVDPPLQPKNDVLSEEVRPPVRPDAPDSTVSSVGASVDPDVTNYVQPISTDEIPGSGSAEQALILVSQEESGSARVVEEVVSQEEPVQTDDGAAMDVDLPEHSLDVGEPIVELENAALPELETQPMDVYVDAGEVDASEGVASPVLEDGEEVDGGILDGPVITPAHLEPIVEEEEEGEVRASPRPVDVPTDSKAVLAPSNEDEDNVTHVSESASERAPSTPDAQQDVQFEDVGDDQAQDVPKEPVSVQDVQDGITTSTSTSTSSADASEPFSVPSKDVSEQSRDDQGTSVNENEPDHTSQSSLIASREDLYEQSHPDQATSASDSVDLSEQSRDDQSATINEADQNSQLSSTSNNDDPSPRSPRGSNTSVDEEDAPLPLMEHDGSANNDLGLRGRQGSPSEPSADPIGDVPNVVDMADEEGKDHGGDFRTLVEPPFVFIDGGASATDVSYSDKAGLNELNSIVTGQHQGNNAVSSDVHLNATDSSNSNNTTTGMDTTDNVFAQAVDVPISDSTPVSNGHVVQPMFRPGVTILGILPGNEESTKATSRFVLQNGIETLLAQWRSRYKTQMDITNSASVSLACYRSKDMAETLSVVGTSPDAASEFVNSCPQTWPTDGSLSFGMLYNGKRQFIPLAPPLLPTHDRFLDVSQFVHEGDNTFELEFEPSAKVYTCILFVHHPTQTQLADVAARRKSKAQWAQQLSSCFRPLEIPTFVF